MVHTISPTTLASKAEDSFDDDMFEDSSEDPTDAPNQPTEGPPPAQIECTNASSQLTNTRADDLFADPILEEEPDFRVQSSFQ